MLKGEDMIVRFTSNLTGRWRDIDTDAEDYPRAMLECCGGGYTELQTARAMETLQQIRDGEEVIRGDFIIVRVSA